MADKEDKVSPEEKLLRVIQKGSEESPKAAASESSVPSASGDAGAGPADAATQSASAAGGVELIGGGGTLVSGRRHAFAGFSLRTVNRSLAVAAGILVLLTAYEIVAAATLRPAAGGNPPAAVGPRNPAATPEAQTLPKLADMQAAMDATPLIAAPGQQAASGGPDDQPKTPDGDTPGGHVRKNFDLIALWGEKEAIVMDNETKAMYFLTVGKSVPVKGRDFELKEIHSDFVVFTDGFDSVMVK